MSDTQPVPKSSRIHVPLGRLILDLERYSTRLADPKDSDSIRSWIVNIRDEENLNLPPNARILSEFVRVCVQNGLQMLLAAHELPHPTYNYLAGFEDNAKGPWDSFPQGWLARQVPAYKLLGYEIGYPVGVPASVLTSTAAWVEYYARRGFNVLTFKTVRSAERDVHPAPNWLFVEDCSTPFTVDQIPTQVTANELTWPSDTVAFSMANSFGVPSFAPDVWQREVKDSLDRILPDQLLIVSVMGTYEEKQGQAMIDDFADAAILAEETGARAIELNLSCPNTVDKAKQSVKKDLLCKSANDTKHIVAAVRERLQNSTTKLVIKLGYMSPQEQYGVLSELFSLGDGIIDGVAGINTLQVSVRQSDGSSTFKGTVDKPMVDRDPAGVSGIAIRDHGMDFVKTLRRLRQENGWRFDIIGMGGVMCAADVLEYRRLGADAVQTATGAFFHPDIPEALSNLLWQQNSTEFEIRAREKVALMLRDSPRSFGQLIEAIGSDLHPNMLIAERVREILHNMENDGIVKFSRPKGSIVFELSGGTPANS